MSGTRKKQKQTSKNTESHSAKRQKSSTTRTPSTSKNKKSTASSPRVASRQKKEEIWADFDQDEVPEMNREQIKDLVANAMSREQWLKTRKGKRSGGKKAS